MTIIERFWSKVNMNGPTQPHMGSACWEWTGGDVITKSGHARFHVARVGGRHVRIGAHRMAAKIAFGAFDERLLVLHRCDNPLCVRWSHLYLGDHADNAFDRDERGRNGSASKTHCKRGHEFTEANTYVQKGDGVRYKTDSRHCRACDAEKHRQKRLEKV